LSATLRGSARAAPSKKDGRTRSICVRSRTSLALAALLCFSAVGSAALQRPLQPASISGVVVDAASKQPLADANVTLAGRLVNQRRVEVDALGRFSFSGITPGVYSVEASAGYHHLGYLGTAEPDRRWFFELKEGERRDGEVISLTRWAQISGRVVDDTGKPLAGVWVSALFPAHRSGLLVRNSGNTGLTDANGNYHLDFVAGADRLMAFPPLPYQTLRSFLSPMTSFRPTFFPAATDPALAAPLVVVPGADVRGMDIVMQRGPTASIRIGFPERPAYPTRLQVLLEPAWCGSAIWCWIKVREGTVTGTSITFGEVPAGTYRISYVLEDPSKIHGDLVSEEFRLSQGWQEVEVGGRDASVRIESWNGFTVSGKVEFPSPTDQTRARVCLNALDDSDQYCTTTDPNGTFSIRPVPRDDYTVSVAPVTTRSSPVITQAARSVTLDGADVTDRPFRLTKNAEILATMTDHLTKLTGAVTGDADLLLQSWVVAFPADPSMWTGFGPQPRRMRKARVIDGKFTMPSLPAGDYWLVALPDDLSVDYRWQFPERLRAWVPRATRVFLIEGETVRFDLRVIDGR